jgi:hypothetical protein
LSSQKSNKETVSDNRSKSDWDLTPLLAHRQLLLGNVNNTPLMLLTGYDIMFET